jgi:hypothetical protein
MSEINWIPARGISDFLVCKKDLVNNLFVPGEGYIQTKFKKGQIIKVETFILQSSFENGERYVRLLSSKKGKYITQHEETIYCDGNHFLKFGKHLMVEKIIFKKDESYKVYSNGIDEE